MDEVKLTGLKDVVAWLECQPHWSGVAVRRVDDPPIPGEPFISMESAKHLIVSAVSIMDNRSFEAAARIEALERERDETREAALEEAAKVCERDITSLTVIEFDGSRRTLDDRELEVVKFAIKGRAAVIRDLRRAARALETTKPRI